MRLLAALLIWLAALGAAQAAQYVAPYTGRYVGAPRQFGHAGPTSGSGLNTSCAQGVAYNAALDGTATVQFKTDAATLICGLVADGTFSQLKLLYLHANTSAANSRVNATSPGTFNQVEHGTVTFTAGQGIAGDGTTGYEDTTFNPSVNGGGVISNISASSGVCVVNTRGSVNENSYGATDGTNFWYLTPYFTGQTFWSIEDGGSTPPVSTGSAGSWIQSRTGPLGSDAKLYLNGSTVATSTVSTGILAADILELAFNNNGTPSGFDSDTQAYFFVGGGLSPSQVSSVYARFANFVAARGITGGCSNQFASVPSYFATAGADGNPCTQISPCQTIAKANALLLGPNASLFFNGGDTFNGCLSITPSNAAPNALNPLTITSYGTGRARINTTCSGGLSAGLTLDAVTGVNVSNIDFVQGGNSPPTMACILITNTAGTNASGSYTIQNNTCTGGFTSQGGGVSGLTGGGITIRGFTNGCAPINNVVLRNNTIFGAAVTSPDQNGIFGSDGCTGPGNLNNYTAEGNLCFNLGGTNPNTGTNPGNCVLFIDGSSTLQQFNLAHDNAWNCTVSPGCGVSFWNDQVNNAEIRFSEGFKLQAGFSTAGTDFDCTDHDQGVTNSVIEYVYCHDNFGYGVTGVMAGVGGWGPNTVRYMITENDNARTGDLTAGLISFFNNGAPGLLYVYNTTIWANHTTSPTRTAGYANQSGWPSGGIFANNSISLTADSFGLFTPVACVNVDATTIAQPFHHNDYNNLSSVTQQFYTCGAGGTSIAFAAWQVAITGGDASTIQTAPGFVGSPPDAACTWTPNTIAKTSSSWPPSGCAASVALASGAQNAKSAGANLANGSWPGGAPTRDFFLIGSVPGTGPCYNIGAYGTCP